MIIDGKKIAAEIRGEIAKEVSNLKSVKGREPGLAVILVGEDPASKIYVSAKGKAAEQCGMAVFDFTLPKSTSEDELHKLIWTLNDRSDIDGILLQLPLPKQLDEKKAIEWISPAKDVDGLHPLNQGRLLRGERCFQSCTPKGCIELVKRAAKELGWSTLEGRRAVVIGRSILVGKPMAQLLLAENLTVTTCHSRTLDLPSICREADVIVAAIGRSELVTAEFVKPGAIVIDVGINRMDDGSLRGDVKFSDVKEIAGAITPVPGGVGPMTIAMLLANTLEAAQQ